MGKVIRAKVDREMFLQKLTEVEPGLTRTEIVEQTSCFAFTKGRIITYNEEVACRAKSGLPKEVTGAVQHAKFLEMLRKFPDPTITLEFNRKEVVIHGKNKEAGQAMEKEVLLPMDMLSPPKDWRPISDDFTDAVGIVQECATKDESSFTLTCVHIHPKWMEAFDNEQMARYTLKSGVSKSFLVKRDALRHLPRYDLTHISESDKWLHVKTSNGTIISVIRYVEQASDYQNLTDILKKAGDVIVFPKSLNKAAERAEVHSSDNSENNVVQVEMRPGKLRITGRGDQGYYVQKMAIKYGGAPIKFNISPKLLVKILDRDTECQITKDYKLKVSGGNFTYLACLQKA